MYAQIIESEIVFVSRPTWFTDTGDPVSDEYLATEGYFKVVDEVPVYDPNSHSLTQNPRSEWTIGTDTITVTYTITEIGTEDIRQRVMNAVTNRRWEIETEGLILPTGVLVKTTIEDQNRITSVLSNAPLAGITSVGFKAAEGWIDITIEDLKDVAGLIGTYVQNCFNAERVHHSAITNCTRQQLLDYDINAGWPNNDLST